MSASVGNKHMHDRRLGQMKSSLKTQQNQLRNQHKGPNRADVELLRNMNTQLSYLLNQPGGQHKRLHYRSIPKLLTSVEYGYESSVYESAANIFQSFLVENTETNNLIEYAPPPTWSQTKMQLRECEALQSERTKLQTYELAFRALKYKSLFEQVLLESGHLRKHGVSPELAAVQVVMLVDFQSRDFSSRPDVIGDDVPDYLHEIEQALHENKVCLAAALARCRIKNQSQTIDFILPTTLRNFDTYAENLPQYFWVNTMKTTVGDVIEKLNEMGYDGCDNRHNLLPMHGKYYRMDVNCEDLMLVPHDQRDVLDTCDLVFNSEIILQDKTSCLAVLTMESLFATSDTIEVIHSDVSSGLTTAHLAISLYRTGKKREETRKMMVNKLNFAGEPKGTRPNKFWECTKTSTYNPPIVYAFGVKSEEHRHELETMFAEMNVKNIELIKLPFTDRNNFNDPKFSLVKSILITPQGTRSAVVNPIDFMLKEGDAKCMELLQDLSGGTLRRRATVNGISNLESLMAAMHYKTVTSLVYETRSKFKEENEDVLIASLEKQPGGIAQSRFKLSPPTISLTSNDVGGDDNKATSPLLRGKFLKIEPSNEMNGCFVGIFVKSMEYIMKVKDVKKVSSQSPSTLGDAPTEAPNEATSRDTIMSLETLPEKKAVMKKFSGRKASFGESNKSKKSKSEKSKKLAGAASKLKRRSKFRPIAAKSVDIKL